MLVIKSTLAKKRTLARAKHFARESGVESPEHNSQGESISQTKNKKKKLLLYYNFMRAQNIHQDQNRHLFQLVTLHVS